MFVSYRHKLSVVGSILLVWILIGGCTGGENPTSSVPVDVNASDASDGANGADVMFAQMMIPHHEQAVVMAELALDRAKDAQLLALAEEIKSAQAPEIELMSSWLDKWGVPKLSGEEAMNSHGSHGMEGMLADSQIEALAAAEGDTFDALFAQYMIEHHEGAVAMGQDVLARGADRAVAALAREIIVTQEKEIVQLRAFLSGESTVALTDIEPGLGHVHGVVIDGNELLLGTHDGLHRVNPMSGASQRVGDSQDDLMSFSGNADAILVASGHPGPGSTSPNPLGLITSRDGGETWGYVSLLGEVDFHGLAVRESDIVGWDTRGSLLWSSDGGETWLQGPSVVPTSIAWFGDLVWLGTPDRGLLTWRPGDEDVLEVGLEGVLVAASPDESVLWRLDGDGSVHRSTDGQRWNEAGRASQVEALAGDATSAYVVTGNSVAVLNASDS